jgi:hypothetical protein
VQGTAARGVGEAIALAPDDAHHLAARVKHATAAVARPNSARDGQRRMNCADGGGLAGHGAANTTKLAVRAEAARRH